MLNRTQYAEIIDDIRNTEKISIDEYIDKHLIPLRVVHEVPEDLKKALLSDTTLLDTWNKLTPLARNEWICWVTIVKKPETREEHIHRLSEELLEGKRRPCCWPGCPHRRPKAQKWFK